MYILECWIEHPVRQLNQTFSYLSDEPCEQGVRVIVDFNGRKITGFVETCVQTGKTPEELEQEYGYTLKYAEEILDSESLLTEELHDLAHWMSRETLSTRISCFQAMLPAKIKPLSNRREIVREQWVTLSDKEVSLTPKQLEAYQYVQNQGTMLYSALRKQYPNQAKVLVEKGALILQAKEKEAAALSIPETSEPLALTPEQAQVFTEIQTSRDTVFLLQGVTGSGKTEVYLQLAQEVLKQGRQVLILVPEISLTPQMIDRVSSRFGNTLAIYHSGLNDQEKYEQYRMVKEKKARVVVGTRSAVFLPFHDLGLIVMDEEHDSSYKQENQPAYHCRDIAIHRAQYHHCKIVLGSATPSLDSYARAIRGVYHLVTLKHRINETLPKVDILSLRECMKKGQSYILSDPLKEKIAQRLEKHQQVILLLNRRGYSSVLRCRECQEPVICPHCDIAMSYHREERVMKCHTCGTILPVPRVCPECGSTAGYTSYGFGTQRLEETLQEAFPDARLLRMDADTTSRKNSHQKILEQFGRHEADILLGTQMIAKGLDYPDVTLVGVLNGDDGLNRTDYRSCETTFDLLMQAGGRSGRAEEPGEVVYQVYNADHYAIQCAARQDYETFFRYEMQFRHAGQYPPYTYLIALTFTDKNEKKAEETARWYDQNLQGEFRKIGVISLNKIQDRYRKRILLKGKDLAKMKEAVAELLERSESRYTKDVRIDVNPMVLD